MVVGEDFLFWFGVEEDGAWGGDIKELSGVHVGREVGVRRADSNEDFDGVVAGERRKTLLSGAPITSRLISM